MALETLQIEIESATVEAARTFYGKHGRTLEDVLRAMVEDSVSHFMPTSRSATKKLHAAGIASAYADPSKIPFEKDAFAKAMEEKHLGNAHLG